MPKPVNDIRTTMKVRECSHLKHERVVVCAWEIHVVISDQESSDGDVIRDSSENARTDHRGGPDDPNDDPNDDRKDGAHDEQQRAEGQRDAPVVAAAARGAGTVSKYRKAAPHEIEDLFLQAHCDVLSVDARRHGVCAADLGGT
jgi:hypothetical protein